MARRSFFLCLALTVCSCVGAVGVAFAGHGSELALVPFLVLFVLTAHRGRARCRAPAWRDRRVRLAGDV